MDIIIGLLAGATLGFIMSFLQGSFKMHLPRIVWVIGCMLLGLGMTLGVIK